MDGASKFVKGDAIAGIIITIINIGAGFLIGIIGKGMPFSQALQRYTCINSWRWTSRSNSCITYFYCHRFSSY